MDLVYQVSRLFANPRVFYAIANYLEGPDGHTLRETFYDLLEYDFIEEENPEDCEFDATEVIFTVDRDTRVVTITLNTGFACTLNPLENESETKITNDHEMSATSAIYQRIVAAIEETNEAFVGDIALVSPPTPGNQYLRSFDGERFQGSFHLLSDPERQYSFDIEIIDVQQDILKATYKPLF